MCCSQSCRHKTKTKYHQFRQTDTKRIQNCVRMLSISKPKQGMVILRCKHCLHHETIRTLTKLNESDIARIKALSALGLTPFQICSLRTYENRDTTWKQVNYHWSLLQKEAYFKNEDPHSSCRQYIENANHL